MQKRPMCEKVRRRSNHACQPVPGILRLLPLALELASYLVADLDALNALLLSGCRADEARVLDGRAQTVGAALAEERGHLLSRATEGLIWRKWCFRWSTSKAASR